MSDENGRSGGRSHPALAYARESETVSNRDGAGGSSVFLCRMKEDIQTAPGG
ncbi:MAG: hypothetical protein ABI610_14190 [Acidobacteriota bacterium]